VAHVFEQVYSAVGDFLLEELCTIGGRIDVLLADKEEDFMGNFFHFLTKVCVAEGFCLAEDSLRSGGVGIGGDVF
jgi:hypothetical protein